MFFLVGVVFLPDLSIFVLRDKDKRSCTQFFPEWYYPTSWMRSEEKYSNTGLSSNIVSLSVSFCCQSLA